jgi:hypothetical protein
MRRALLALLAAAGALLLTACGDPAPPGAPGATTAAPSAPTSPTPGDSGTGAPTGAPTGASTGPTTLPPGVNPTPAPGRRITVEGIVEEGVEPGCKVLTTASGSYQILGGDVAVPLGVRVRISGVAMTAVSTTCQQGTPLRVVSVQRR